MKATSNKQQATKLKISYLAKSLSYFTLFIFLFMTLNSTGQTIVPAQDPDILLIPQPGIWDIENTGCDLRDGYAMGDQRSVMVYDGSSPYFQWFDAQSQSNGIALNSGINDPDIVITIDGIYILKLDGDAINKTYKFIKN